MTPEWVQALSSLVQAAAVVAAGGWVLYEVRKYRRTRHCIQLDIDARLFLLDSPIKVSQPTWDKRGDRRWPPAETHKYALEVVLQFANKGLTRFRLYNAQVAVNTMRQADQTQFDDGDGHLHLTRLTTSGNIVPEMRIEKMDVSKTSFYYIEPGVQQDITHLVLLPEPRDLIQIVAYFSLAPTRHLPKVRRVRNYPYPHNVARTFGVANGQLVGRD